MFLFKSTKFILHKNGIRGTNYNLRRGNFYNLKYKNAIKVYIHSFQYLFPKFFNKHLDDIR